MKVAIQGQENSFHSIAARRLYGNNVELIFCETFKHTFEAVKNKVANEAVVAIENSLYGSLNDVYDLLNEHDFWIHGEVYELINFHLFGTKDSSLEVITDVYSHPAALGETDAYFESNMPNVKKHESSDTAAAAEMIAKQGLPNQAAIASKQAGEKFGLKILASNIETHPDNYTRFIALSPNKTGRTEATKTSITFRTSDTPGALYKVLGVFAKQNINLTKLESRPIIGKAWSYVYYIDFALGLDDPEAKAAMQELENYATNIKILGSYKAGVTMQA